MTSVVIGHIKHNESSDYTVRMFKDKINPMVFKTLRAAVAYAKKHAYGILKTDETSAVAIHYERRDLRASYLIFERMINEEGFEVLEYEESAYDYVNSHKSFFPVHLTRKMINEKYYSFHDFARVSTLTTTFTAVLRITINILAILTSFIFLFYGLHAINMSDVSSALGSDRTVLNIYVPLGSIATLIVASSALISYSLPLYKLSKVNWNYDEIDWRKLNKIRNRAKLVSVSVVVLGLTSLIHYFYVFIDSQLFKQSLADNEGFPMFIISLILSFMFLTIAIMAVSNSIKNKIYLNKNIGKYFLPEEIEEYKKWIKFKSENVPYKTDEDYFVWDFEKSHDIVSAKLEMVEEVERTSTKEEIKEYKTKAFKRYDRALKSYLKVLKQGE